MHCQSLCVLSNVCTVLVEKVQRQLAIEHAAEMLKLRDELVETKIALECTRRVLDQTDRETLYWQDRHHQLAAILQGLTSSQRPSMYSEGEDQDFFSQVWAEVQ